MADNLPALIPMADIEKMAVAVAKSQLFGLRTPEQALTLMLVAQAEGLHPMKACQIYHIIDNKPSMKSEAMLSRFQQAGGKVIWTERTDTRVCATFSHPSGGSVEVDWTIERAKQAGLAGKDTWRKYPRSMLTARVISEGVRTVYPAALGGFYTPEEVGEFGPDRARDITPADEQPKRRSGGQQPAKSRLDAIEELVGTEAEVQPSTSEPALTVDEDGVILESTPEPLPEIAWPAPGSDRGTWIYVSKLAIAQVTALKTEADVLRWQEQNSVGLRMLMQYHNDVYQRLGTKITEHANSLVQS